MDNLINLFNGQTTTQRYSLIFSAGIFYTLFMTGYVSRYINYEKLTNGVTSVRRSLSNKNVFYFDTIINDTSVKSFKNFMNNVKDHEDIHIILSTNGGSFCVVQMISHILARHKGETNAYVLSHAFSAGTLIALSCDNLYMHKNAHLSPVDVIHCSFFDVTQLASISFVLEKKTSDRINDNTLILADQAKKCKIILDEIFNKIVKNKYPEEASNVIYEEIFSGEKYVHNTTFSVEHLRKIGLRVGDIDEEMMTLSKLLYNNKNNLIDY